MSDLSGSGGSDARGRQRKVVTVTGVVGEVTLRVGMKVESVISEGSISVS